MIQNSIDNFLSNSTFIIIKALVDRRKTRFEICLILYSPPVIMNVLFFILRLYN